MVRSGFTQQRSEPSFASTCGLGSWRRLEKVRTPMAKQQKSLKPKIVIIPGRGVSQTINYLLKDRDELDWLVAVGRNKDGEIFFYDTGGDIIEDLGTLEYLKERIVRAHFGDEPD